MYKLKKMIETRNAKIEEMEGITNAAASELRAFTEEEDAKFRALEDEVSGLDAVIERMKASRTLIEAPEERAEAEETTEEREVRALAEYIRAGETGTPSATPADVNMTVGANGAVIPTTIADRIIKRVFDISPILKAATRYTVTGDLVLPYYDETTSAVSVAYAEEFKSVVASAGEFKGITLKGYLAAALSKISRSLLNNTNIGLVDFVVDDVAEKAARWLERELLRGTEGKIAGLSGVKQKVEAASASAITLDELIDLQDSVPDQLQEGAMWIMHRTTRAAIRKLEDKQGRKYLLDDVTAPFGKVLLGKPVYTSDNMPKMEAGSDAIYYGDMSGLAVKFAEDPTIEVVREKFIEQHALGAYLWLEVDAKLQVEQAVSKLTMKAA